MFAVAGDIKKGLRKALPQLLQSKTFYRQKGKTGHTRMQEFIATPNKIKQKTLLDQLKCHLHNKTSCLIKGQRLNNAIKTVLWRL